MESSQAHFRFLDLPKEVRLIIYERLPRCIERHGMSIYSSRNKEIPHQKLTVILSTVSIAMLSACRQINSEASAVVQDIAKSFILLQAPRLIFEAQDHFNDRFLFWILDAISEQAYRRVLGGIRHTLGRTDGVGYIPLEAIWIEPRDTDFGISWMHPCKIEELLCGTQKSRILQFIDQAARQLASSNHSCPPVHIVLGLYHVSYRTGERNRYSMEELYHRGAMTSIWSNHRSLIATKSSRPFDLTAKYSGYLENDERSIPRAFRPSYMGNTYSNISTQIGQDEWEEWLS